MIILLPLLRCLSTRSRLALGLALTTLGLFSIIAALGHGVIAVIVGAIFLASVIRERQQAEMTYSSRSMNRSDASRPRFGGIMTP